jgi:predicted RNA-binding Zn-ribbon protein involved in translation (DUF1610 family)
MKSKPVYAMLEWDPTAKRHLVIAQGAGIAAAQRALAEAPDMEAELLTLSEDAPIPSAVQTALRGAGMDMAFYIAGPEPFIWEATQALRHAGVAKERIRQEAAGSLARRVYCVHCRWMNSGVTATIHRCDQCGTALTVRDHFSRPLSAYMGVSVNAETPGLVPLSETLNA